MKEQILPESVQIQQANEILGKELFGDTFQIMKWRYFTQWLQSESVEERETLHGKVLGLLDAQAEFETIANRALPPTESGD